MLVAIGVVFLSLLFFRLRKVGAKSSSTLPATWPKHPDGKTMTALCFDSYKAPLTLHTDIPRPVPTKDEVLVKIHACSFNPIDKIRQSGGLKLLRAETHFPAVIGYDLAGVVVEVPKIRGRDPDEHVLY